MATPAPTPDDEVVLAAQALDQPLKELSAIHDLIAGYKLQRDNLKVLIDAQQALLPQAKQNVQNNADRLRAALDAAKGTP